MTSAAPLTVDQAAQLLCCADTTVRELAAAGTLPGVKFGRDWVFPVGAFFTALDALALEQAQQRRKPASAPVPVAPARQGVLRAVDAAPAASGRRGHTRPVLPALPGLSPQPGG